MRRVSSVIIRILQVLIVSFIATVSAYAASVTLAWDPNTEPDVAGYRVHYGIASGTYTQVLDVGNSTTATVPNLIAGTTYYLAVTAYNSADIESAASNEVTYTPALPSNLPPAVAFTAPANGSTYLAPASIALNATASDIDGSVARVEFYSGTTKLGEDTTSPYAFTWSGVTSGTYALTARAIDNQGAQTNSVGVTVTVNAPNQVPTVAISNPASGSLFTSPANILINATASDSDGTVARVEFYSGATKLGEDASSPYAFSWSGVTPGTYTLTARAIDNQGAQTNSVGVTVTVNAPNQAPTVAISNPANGSLFMSPANILINATASDSDGTVARVEFYNGATKLGEDTTSPYAFSWSGVTPGTYTLTARAIDNQGSQTNSVGVSVLVNALPTVAISSPTNGSLFTSPANILINATASDSDGTVARVEFYNGVTKLGEDTTSPYAFTWSGVTPGTYTLTARAIDNQGAPTNSAGVTVTVNAPNQAPTVAISNPVNGSLFTSPANILINSTASDADGTVARVEFYNGATKLGEDTSGPYAFTWSGVTPGTYTLTARAIDNQGAPTTSAGVTVTVNAPNQAPTVAISNPASGSLFTAPADILINSTASDTDGTVARVEFYNGATKLGEDTSSPYAFTWSGITPGTYTLTARAIDNQGGQTTSVGVTVTVNTPNQSPTVALTSPDYGVVVTAPADFTLTASASDADGSVARVEFYRDTTKIGEDTTSPYSFTWNAAPVGTYALTARAFDNEGASTTSAIVSVTVNAPPTVAMSTNGTSFTAPASITLTATPSDSDGTIAWVEFFSGSTKLWGSSASPYTFTWNNVGAGTYALTAVAVDNRGAVVTSSAVNVTVTQVNQPPSVAITSPLPGSMLPAPATISINTTASDSDGTVARVDFYSGATKLGTSTESPFSYTWSNVASGTYTLTAVAVDNTGASTTSAQVAVIVNAMPTVTIETNGTTFTEPASVAITAMPVDPDGTITRVEFYDGPTKLGEKSSSPFTFTWANAPAGNHALAARAFDNRGASASSPPVEVTVTPENQAPTVAITSPASGSTFSAPASVSIEATAADADGTIARVEFFRGTTKLGEDTSSPYSFAWNNAPAGTYSLTAVAIDDAGGTTTSTAVNITITAAVSKPIVAITSPVNGNIFASPASVAITATASDSDGTIANVEFYQGATKLGQDTTSPYSYTWNNVATGAYTLTAIATDNAGNKTTSAPVSFTVQGPNVVLTTNGTSFSPGSTIALTASTAQLSGRIRRVDFYRGSVLLYRDTKSPFAYSWKNVPAGTYTLQAKAVMNSGATYTSTPVTVTVGTSQPSAMMAVSSSYEDPMPTVIPYRQQDGTFNLGITGQAGQTYKVWVSTDLSTWSLMTTVANDSGFVTVTDPDAPTHKQRFYRLSVQE